MPEEIKKIICDLVIEVIPYGYKPDATSHGLLSGRDLPEQHPISAIAELEEKLNENDGKNTDQDEAIELNTTHRSSDGSDHGFIDQDVTQTAIPTFEKVTSTQYAEDQDDLVKLIQATELILHYLQEYTKTILIDEKNNTQDNAISLNTTHRSSNGTDHTYIDQDLRSSSIPTFDGVKSNQRASAAKDLVRLEQATEMILNSLLEYTKTTLVDEKNRQQDDKILLNTTHRSSDGTDHGFIDQDLKQSASPKFQKPRASQYATDINGLVRLDQTIELILNYLLEYTKTTLVDEKNTEQDDKILLNTTHRGSDGSDHTFINQDLRTTSSPTFSKPKASQQASLDNDLVRLDQARTMIEDGVDYQDPILNILSDPPSNPSLGDRYGIIPNATGAWAGKEYDLTTWTGTEWEFETPEKGWRVWVEDPSIDTTYTFNGTKWVNTGSTINHNSLNNKQGGQSNEYYHLTESELIKLGEIEPSAEVNVQPDYTQTDNSKDDYIKNKPTKLSQFENDTGCLINKGKWNAQTNTPDISGAKTGEFWEVSVSGDTSLGGENDWQQFDLAIKTDLGWHHISQSIGVRKYSDKSTYEIEEIVSGNGFQYMSLVNDNKGNSLADKTKWVQITNAGKPIVYWLDFVSYERNDISAKNGVFYRSKNDNNLANDPELDDSTNWTNELRINKALAGVLYSNVSVNDAEYNIANEDYSYRPLAIKVEIDGDEYEIDYFDGSETKIIGNFLKDIPAGTEVFYVLDTRPDIKIPKLGSYLTTGLITSSYAKDATRIRYSTLPLNDRTKVQAGDYFKLFYEGEQTYHRVISYEDNSSLKQSFVDFIPAISKAIGSSNSSTAVFYRYEDNSLSLVDKLQLDYEKSIIEEDYNDKISALETKVDNEVSDLESEKINKSGDEITGPIEMQTSDLSSLAGRGIAGLTAYTVDNIKNSVVPIQDVDRDLIPEMGTNTGGKLTVSGSTEIFYSHTTSSTSGVVDFKSNINGTGTISDSLAQAILVALDAGGDIAGLFPAKVPKEDITDFSLINLELSKEATEEINNLLYKFTDAFDASSNTLPAVDVGDEEQNRVWTISKDGTLDINGDETDVFIGDILKYTPKNIEGEKWEYINSYNKTKVDEALLQYSKIGLIPYNYIEYIYDPRLGLPAEADDGSGEVGAEDNFNAKNGWRARYGKDKFSIVDKEGIDEEITKALKFNDDSGANVQLINSLTSEQINYAYNFNQFLYTGLFACDRSENGVNGGFAAFGIVPSSNITLGDGSVLNLTTGNPVDGGGWTYKQFIESYPEETIPDDVIIPPDGIYGEAGKRRYGVSYSMQDSTNYYLKITIPAGTYIFDGTTTSPNGSVLEEKDGSLPFRIRVIANVNFSAASLYIDDVLLTDSLTFDSISTTVNGMIIASGSSGGTNRITYCFEYGMYIYENDKHYQFPVIPNHDSYDIILFIVPPGDRGEYNLVTSNVDTIFKTGMEFTVILLNLNGSIRLTNTDESLPSALFNGELTFPKSGSYHVERIQSITAIQTSKIMPSKFVFDSKQFEDTSVYVNSILAFEGSSNVTQNLVFDVPRPANARLLELTLSTRAGEELYPAVIQFPAIDGKTQSGWEGYGTTHSGGYLDRGIIRVELSAEEMVIDLIGLAGSGYTGNLFDLKTASSVALYNFTKARWILT